MLDHLPGDKALEILAALSKDVYSDGLSPAMKEAGKGLVDTIKILLFPLALAGDTIDVLHQKFGEFLLRAFSKVPEDCLTTPDPRISTPILQNILNSFDDGTICEMYSNLLASASHKEHCCQTHPAFPFIISQLSPMDAVILDNVKERHFLPFMEACVKYEREDSIPLPMVEPFCLIPGYENDYAGVSAAIRNLGRLGLLQRMTPWCVYRSRIRLMPFTRLMRLRQ